MRKAAIFPVILAASAVVAQDRPTPEWASWKAAKFQAAPLKAFVAVGRSGDAGPADYKSEQAEDDARQAMGQIIADWQERTLACAKKASETTSKTKNKGGATLSFEVESETTVSFYRDRVVDRHYEGKTILVLLRHELAPMIAGIQGDSSRSEGLRAAVKSCGERAFDELAGG